MGRMNDEADMEGPDMCVLLVEDEPLIREIMAESLQDAGFDVVEAESGDVAFALITRLHRPFSALVTDFHMPGGQDGAAVADFMRERLPAIPVIIASGRPEVFQAHWRSELGYSFLRKPYTPGDLIGLLTRLMPSA